MSLEAIEGQAIPSGQPIQRGGIPGTRLCGAKKRDGGLCAQPAMDNGRCRMHGGKAATGAQNGNFKHGRYSQHLPKHLVQDFEEAMSDDKLLDLSANIALADTRMNTLLRQLNGNETMEAWSELGMILGPLSHAIKEGKLDKAEAMTNRLLLAWQAFYEDAGTWKEIYEVSELRRKLAESEKKRLMDMNLMISADRVYLLISFIQDVILRHVKDASTRSSIAYELRAVLDRQTSGRVGSEATE